MIPEGELADTADTLCRIHIPVRVTDRGNFVDEMRKECFHSKLEGISVIHFAALEIEQERMVLRHEDESIGFCPKESIVIPPTGLCPAVCDRQFMFDIQFDTTLRNDRTGGIHRPFYEIHVHPFGPRRNVVIAFLEGSFHAVMDKGAPAFLLGCLPFDFLRDGLRLKLPRALHEGGHIGRGKNKHGYLSAKDCSYKQTADETPQSNAGRFSADYGMDEHTDRKKSTAYAQEHTEEGKHRNTTS